MNKYIYILFFSINITLAQEYPASLSINEAISFALENNSEIIIFQKNLRNEKLNCIRKQFANYTASMTSIFHIIFNKVH